MNIDPCPVCGAESTWRGNVEDGWISCETSGCIIGGTFLNTDDGRAAAIAQWNHLAASARLATSVQTLERECDQIVLRRWVGGWTAAGYMAGKVRGGGKGATMEAALSVLLVELAALGETGR